MSPARRQTRGGQGDDQKKLAEEQAARNIGTDAMEKYDTILL